MAEILSYTEKVGGSSPSLRTKFMKSIVIKGKAYKYKVGKTYTKFDNGIVVANWELAGKSSPDIFERGQWKRTSDGMITPRMIREFLVSKYDERRMQ